MMFDERQRKMVRLAYRCTDPELRRAAVARLRAAVVERPSGIARAENRLPRATALTSLERVLIRTAFQSADPVLRRGIVESIRVARYAPEFMKAVEGQTFRNPETGNKVKFVSLPDQEQQKIYQQWAAQQQAQPSGKKHPLQEVEPSAESMSAAHDAVRDFFPARPGSLEELKKLHEAGKPWHLPAVRGGKATGMAFWEARGDGDKIEVRFGPVGSWTQAKPMKSVEEAWKRYQKKLGGPKGYMSAGPSLAMSFGPGPVKLDAEKLWKQIESKHGDDPKKMTEVVRAALDYLGQLDQASKGKWESVKPTMEGLQERWEQAQAKAEKAPEKKAPEMVDMTSDVMEALKQMGPKPKPTVPDEPEPEAKKEAPKKKPAKPKEKAEPQKAEAPKKPAGKHKDRKELRSKPKKKVSDKVEVSEELQDMLLPEGMSAQKREQGKKQLEGASYELLAMVRDRAAKAVKAPKGKYMKGLVASGYTPEGVKKMLTALNKRLEDVEGYRYHPDVLKVANQYDLESEDADELRDFKADKPHRGKKLTPQELFQKFMAKAKPETKERMQGMDLGDFMAMYNAIMAEEDEEAPASPTKSAARLPRQPHAEVSKAFEDGRLGGKDEEDESVSIFDEPAEEKKASLSTEDRRIVRLAHASPDPAVRRQLLALLSL